MQQSTFELAASDGQKLHTYAWLPDGAPQATICIAHGMGEHAARYARLAGELVGAGYAVYANDHRGHGKTADPSALGDFGEAGWDRVVLDTLELVEHAGREQPERPRVLLGHSMGAMLTQQYLPRHGGNLDAAVLSGSPGFGGRLALGLARQVARRQRARVGPRNASERLDRLFEDNNEPFDGPGASGFEWLSRDRDEVRRYVDDPHCGFVLRSGSLCDLFSGAIEARSARVLAGLPRGLPVYVFAGLDDPVHQSAKGLDRMVAAYRAGGLRVDYRLYPGGRHEMFNETNRDEVTRDLLAWLDRTL